MYNIFYVYMYIKTRLRSVINKTNGYGYYKSLYINNGYIWSQELADFVRCYGGKEVLYKHEIHGGYVLARFCRPIWIRVGRSALSQDIIDFCQEEVAPVGDCDNNNIKLYLSQSGKLIGVADCGFLIWGGVNAGWRISVRSLLNGDSSLVIGD